MLMVKQEEEAMKSESVINVSSRVDEGDSLLEETGSVHRQLENEIMVAGKLREQRLDTRWWWCITKSRKLYIVLLLLVTISASGVAVVFQYSRNDNNAAVVTGQVKSGYLNEKYQSNKDDVDNYLLRQSDRMAQRSYSRVEPPVEMGYLNVYIREPNSYGYRRPFQRVRFPTARYNRRRFPLVGPFMNFRLSMPIFVDPSSGQTIIHSSRGSIYVMPPLSNVYGKIFSIGELIASGYASFINTGIDMTSIADFGTLFRPGPLMGPGIPRINLMRGGFMGGVRTRYRSFFPRKFSNTPTYDGYPDYESEDEDNYQAQSYSNDNYFKKRPETISKVPTCSDGVKNQYEILVDCGGPCSGKNTCANGFSCINGPDCISGVCQSGLCQATTTATTTTEMPSTAPLPDWNSLFLM